MSIQTDLALRATLEDFTKARDETVKLLGEGLRLCQMARECSEKHVRYGFPTDVIPRIGLAKATKEIDARWWRYCFTATGLMKIMDAKATREFENSLQDNPPPFTLESIESMVLEMYQRKDEYALRGIYSTFRELDRSYRSNDKQRFKVEKRNIVTWLFDTWYTVQGKFHINYQKRSWVNDLDRCICLLMDQPYQEHSLESAIQAQIKESGEFENEFIRLKGFKNGNGHLYVHNQVLLDRINRCIAEYCGPSIPDDRVNDKQQQEAAYA
jgi:hypothetical protein